MDSPKISIITRTRNRPILLARAVESVLGQQDPPAWEWIVVNDAGDPAEVRRVLEPATNRHLDRVKLIHIPESHGMEHASNSGIRTASGDYLVIHDDDDSWEPAFLNRMCEWLDQPEHAAHAGVVCHSIRVVEEIGDEGIRITGTEPFNQDLRTVSPWRLLEQNAFPPISFVFRRNVWEAVGPFDEELPVLGDWEFNMRVVLHAEIGLLPELLARYHHRMTLGDGDMANSINAGHNRHLEWESRLRKRWMHSPPGEGLPYFGILSKTAGAHFQNSTRLDRLLSLPMRPGPQV